jgi:single-strand DNA-binding protein
MSNMNCIFLSGNIVRDPELRYTNNGNALLTFSIAVNRNFQQNGEWQRETTFVDVKAWGQTAERASERMAKGTEVVVSGRLQQDSWQASDGTQRSKLVVIADRLHVVRGGKTYGNSHGFVPAVDDDDLPF